MTWTDFYLICFGVGFCLSLVSFLMGGLHWHLPDAQHALGHFHSGPHGAGHGSGHGHAAGGHAAGNGGGRIATGAETSPINFVTLTAFLAWFGGVGYLVTRYSGMWFAAGLLIAALSGLAGASVIYWFISRVLTSREENMDPADYEMAGVLGRVCSPIREGGTGEILYSQAGTRRTCGARSDNGAAIAKGSEVIVTRYERGLAYVRLWAEMAKEESEAAGSGK